MPFKGVDLEDLKHSRQLRDHALRYFKELIEDYCCEILDKNIINI
jgi:hypothetical protein